jgi:hypothetical protein
MSRKNIVLLAAVGVGVVLLGVATWLLLKGIREFRAAEADLDRAEVALNRYYAHDPFPSRENVARERANLQTLQAWFERLRDALRVGQIEEVQKSPSNFMTILSEKKNALVRKARAMRTELPNDFAFGFARYATQGVLPAPGDVARLTQQLVIVERLTGILIEERVRAIDDVAREVFEESAVAARAEAAPARGRSRREPRSARTESEPAVQTESAPDALYGKQRFVLKFKSGETALRNILNRLAGDAMFAVVTSLKVEKEADDVAPPSLTRGGEPGRAAEAEDGADVRAEAPSRRDRVVSGPERAVPLVVHLELDVYRFKGE